MRRVERAAALVAALCLVWLIFACTPAPSPEQDRRDIERVLETRRQLMQERRVEGLYALLSPSYHDEAGGPNEARTLIKEAIGGASRLEVALSGRVVEVHGDEAQVTQQYFLVAEYDGLTQSLKGTEHLRFRREGGAWKIVGGLTK